MQQLDRQFPLRAGQRHGNGIAQAWRHRQPGLIVQRQQGVVGQEPGWHDLFQRALDPDRRDLVAQEAALLEAGHRQPEQRVVRALAAAQRAGIGGALQAASGVEHHRQRAAVLGLELGGGHDGGPLPGVVLLLGRQPALPGDHALATPEQAGAWWLRRLKWRGAWRRLGAVELGQVALEPLEMKAQRLLEPLGVGSAAQLFFLRLDIAQEQHQQHDADRHQCQQAGQPEQGAPARGRSLAGVQVERVEVYSGLGLHGGGMGLA